MENEISKTDILKIDENVRDHQLERLEKVKQMRDGGAVANVLEKLKKGGEGKCKSNAFDNRSGERIRHRRRNLHGFARCLRHL